VKIGIDTPKSVKVLRDELAEEDKRQTRLWLHQVIL
jgi:sRNA-binding carbon storage regulator CsrA